MGAAIGLNTHAHSEQPQPRKRCSSIQTSLRCMSSLSQLSIWCVYAFVKDGVALFFLNATATIKDAFGQGGILRQAARFERTSKRIRIH